MENERQWQSEKKYLKDQDENSSWGFKTSYGNRALGYFVVFGDWLIELGKLYHDDTVADFGGNDGTAANQFYIIHKIKPMVVDCEDSRLEYARTRYKLPVHKTFLESMPGIKDKSITWGFCSHTIEHVRDADVTLKEMARVISGGCLFIIPLEPFNHAVDNPAHARCSMKVSEWKALIRANGWKVVKAKKMNRFEVAIYAEPV